MQVTVEIPDEFVSQIIPSGSDGSRLLLEESVAGAYREHRLTMEQVRQVLGFETCLQVDGFLQRHGVFDYTVADLDHDLSILDQLPAKAE
ncbi:UPF0175 family protein [Terriglobus albidus]|uniref:UPF0175 family protein n=1 Tax=Terriglobus albidus TaxID=1592106 RepID=UPI0021E0CF81|nr:UPF0175 family protein [Terriglobus albidus]